MTKLIDTINKNRTFTLKFSILFIFLVLFILSIFSLIGLLEFSFIRNMDNLSFTVMKEKSQSIHNEVLRDMKSAEVKSKSIATLIQLGIINPHNLPQIIGYTNQILWFETLLIPAIQSISWGDSHGNFVMAEKQDNGSIKTKIINRDKTPVEQYFINRDVQGKIISTIPTDFKYDPRIRPWYMQTKKEGKTTWQDVFTYILTHLQGISVASPVFKDHVLEGVVNLNIRLDYLTAIIEKVIPSRNGIAFILDNNGNVVAFPHYSQFKKSSLVNIQRLPIHLEAAYAFDQFKKTHQDQFIFKFQGIHYLAHFQALTNFGNNKWTIVSIAPQNDFIEEFRKSHLIALFQSVVILIFGILAVLTLVSRVVKPLKIITNEINKIKNFELSEDQVITSRIKEINLIANALSDMKNSLRSFQKYVPRLLVRELIETGEDVRIGGVKKSLAIFFSDIKDFTTISEKLHPDVLMQHLCDYFENVSNIIVSNNGTIDKYIGDAVMAFWGAPSAQENPGFFAAKSALEWVRVLDKLNKKWQALNKPILITRIGLHLGEAIVGNVGSSERLNYTAIGDAINITSRLESINKVYGTQIIVSDALYQEISDNFIFRLLDCIAVKGKTTGTLIYELVAFDKAEVDYDIALYNIYFTAGFSFYKNREWEKAIGSFSRCEKINTHDHLAPLFIKRCRDFELNPPDSTWTGMWFFAEK